MKKIIVGIFVVLTLLIVNTISLQGLENEKEKSYDNDQPILKNVTATKIIITRPQQGHFYIFDKEVLRTNFQYSHIIGKITIFAKVIDPVKDIEKVEFLIDNIVIFTCYQPPYMWTWNIRKYSRGVHDLCVIAYDIDGNWFKACCPIFSHYLIR